ncbi:MAG TPA: hypothetical protein VN844_10905 [Pyrinomonadaceae bacterium]|nr:hypothetical protein [Pyrinomonadaceae bacterium]
MLLNAKHLEGIASGKIKLAFRKWKKPTVKTGGRLRTRIGVLAIQAVDRISEKEISDRDAKLAGFKSKADLLQDLKSRDGLLYRIRLSLAGPDERTVLRTKRAISNVEWVELKEKLDRLDAYGIRGPWVIDFLSVVSLNPGVLSTTLASSIGLERKWFKEHMRKLKELGLTESLGIGYRISPRGETVLKRLKSST